MRPTSPLPASKSSEPAPAAHPETIGRQRAFEDDWRSCTLGTSGRKLPQGWPCPHAGRRRPEVVHGMNIDLEIPRWPWPAGRSETPREWCTGEHRLPDSRRGGTRASRRVERTTGSCVLGQTSGGTQPDGGQHRLEEHRYGWRVSKRFPGASFDIMKTSR
jgi:hypothetical protein